MSIYKGFGGNGHPVLNERRYEEVCEAYADARERVKELESEVDELKDELDRVKKRNAYLEDMHDGENEKYERFKNKIEDYNGFGSELLIDLMVSFYDSEAMHEFEKCFDEDERINMKIEADYRIAEMLKEDEEDE